VAGADDGVAAFATVYADPLVVNGLETPLLDLGGEPIGANG